MGGIAFGLVLGISGGIAFGISGGLVLGIGAFLGLFRVPLYFISGPSAVRAYFASKKQSHETLKFLRRSSLHWDERVYLPLPFLKQILLIAYSADPLGVLRTFDDLFIAF